MSSEPKEEGPRPNGNCSVCYSEATEEQQATFATNTAEAFQKSSFNNDARHLLPQACLAPVVDVLTLRDGFHIVSINVARHVKRSTRKGYFKTASTTYVSTKRS